jgi:hypothetical protein
MLWRLFDNETSLSVYTATTALRMKRGGTLFLNLYDTEARTNLQ